MMSNTSRAPRESNRRLSGARFVYQPVTTGLGEQGFDFPLKDYPGDDAVMGCIGLAVVGRVTDGISALSKHLLNELTVLLVIGQIESHLVNYFGHRMPYFGPLLNSGPFSISAVHECLQQLVSREDSVMNGLHAHSHMLPVDAAWLIVPWHQFLVAGFGKFLL